MKEHKQNTTVSAASEVPRSGDPSTYNPMTPREQALIRRDIMPPSAPPAKPAPRKEDAAGHTPGPWHVDIARPGCVRDENDSIVADELHNADARLIAAAPETAAERDRLSEQVKELLAALKAVHDELGQVSAAAFAEISEDVKDKLCAAIASVDSSRGEAPLSGAKQEGLAQEQEVLEQLHSIAREDGGLAEGRASKDDLNGGATDYMFDDDLSTLEPEEES